MTLTNGLYEIIVYHQLQTNHHFYASHTCNKLPYSYQKKSSSNIYIKHCYTYQSNFFHFLLQLHIAIIIIIILLVVRNIRFSEVIQEEEIDTCWLIGIEKSLIQCALFRFNKFLKT